MSLYALNKALWEVARDQTAAVAYMTDPDSFLEGRSLSDEERRMLRHKDYAALFASAAHPFLLYTFRIKVSGGWSFQLMLDHVAAIAHIDPPLDIST